MTNTTNAMPGKSGWPLGPINTLILATVALSVFFLIFPGADLWLSRQFYVPELGFPAARVPALIWLRSLSAALNWAVAAMLATSIVIKLAVPHKPIKIEVRATLLLVGSYALATGLLVNGILKTVSGRPRPDDIIEFGGEFVFAPVWHFSDQCARNCSFVSGEASSAIWLLALALVVPQRWRRPTAMTAAVLAIMFSMNRIAFGGHFLSDVLISWALTLLVIALLHHVLYVRPPRVLQEAALESVLTRAGLAIRRALGQDVGDAPAGPIPTADDDDEDGVVGEVGVDPAEREGNPSRP